MGILRYFNEEKNILLNELPDSLDTQAPTSLTRKEGTIKWAKYDSSKKVRIELQFSTR